MKAQRLGVQALVWVGCLFLESEFLAVRNYELRTEIRALLQIPLYHLTFSFLAFALFLYRLQAARFGPLQLDSLRWPWVVLHWLVFAGVEAVLHPLRTALAGYPPWLQLLTWCLVLALFGGSWIACLLRPSRWAAWLRTHGPWLGMALLLGTLSLGIIHVSNWLWRPLASGTMTLANFLLTCIYDDVTVNPAEFRLGTSSFQIEIEPGCSGYEGIGLVLMFSLTYLWLRRSQLIFPRALMLLPLGCALNWFINGLRIAALIVLGTNFSRDLAMKGFHSQAGWLAFIATSACLVLAVEQGGWFQLAAASAEEEQAAYPAALYLVPLLAVLLGTMVGSAFSTGFPLLYPLRILLALGVLVMWPQDYRRLLGRLYSARAVVTGLAVYVLWCVLVPGRSAAAVWGVVGPAWAWTWVVFRVLGSSVVIPMVEELAFRGYLMRRLQSADFENVCGDGVGWKAWLFSSLAFGLLHQQWLAATLAGLAYAQLVRRGGSLGQAVMAHGLTNLCISVQVLCLGHWSLWS